MLYVIYYMFRDIEISLFVDLDSFALLLSCSINTGLLEYWTKWRMRKP